MLSHCCLASIVVVLGRGALERPSLFLSLIVANSKIISIFAVFNRTSVELKQEVVSK